MPFSGLGLRPGTSFLGVTVQDPMGGCQNYGPFLGPYYNTAPII